MQVTNPLKKRFNERTQPLDVFFAPKTVAVVGATENPGSVGLSIDYRHPGAGGPGRGRHPTS